MHLLLLAIYTLHVFRIGAEGPKADRSEADRLKVTEEGKLLLVRLLSDRRGTAEQSVTKEIQRESTLKEADIGQ